MYSLNLEVGLEILLSTVEKETFDISFDIFGCIRRFFLNFL